MHPHGSGFLTRVWHARASLDFCTFCFHNLHRETKNQDYFHPKPKTKNALSFRFSPSLGTAPKMSHISTKTWEILTKTSEFFEKTWEKFSKMSELFLKHSEILQTQPGHFFHSATKIERRNPFPLKLPSFYLLFSSQAEKIRQSFCPKLPDFSPRFPLFHQHSLNVC